MSENNNEVRTVICPRCKYEHAEIHDLVMADTGIKIGQTIRCTRCQKVLEEKMIAKVIAWDKVNKEMIEDVAGINFKAEMIVTSDLCFYPFKDIELMQSSGLTDYHYDEYFEGDIARDVTSEEIGVVEYVEGAFVMRFDGGDSVDLSDVKDEFEIVGNKFEDGYLLEEG